MRTFLECIPCFLSQALKAAKLVTQDNATHENVLRAVLVEAGRMDLSITPPAMGQIIHRIIREHAGNRDPYIHVKDRSNSIMLKLYPGLKTRIDRSDDPFETAVRLAIAGNIIDYAVKKELDESQIKQVIEDSLVAPLPQSSVDDFRLAITQADTILYLADNAGEIVCDRLLIEKMPREKVTLVVRGYPVINDVTMDDARAVGMTELVEVIDNGSDAPGTILETCSEHFRERFNEADLIIAKGQGNYETLSDIDKNIFYLFKAKCPVIATHAGEEVGNLVLQRTSVLGPEYAQQTYSLE